MHAGRDGRTFSELFRRVPTREHFVADASRHTNISSHRPEDNLAHALSRLLAGSLDPDVRLLVTHRNWVGGSRRYFLLIEKPRWCEHVIAERETWGLWTECACVGRRQSVRIGQNARIDRGRVVAPGRVARIVIDPRHHTAASHAGCSEDRGHLPGGCPCGSHHLATFPRP